MTPDSPTARQMAGPANFSVVRRPEDELPIHQLPAKWQDPLASRSTILVVTKFFERQHVSADGRPCTSPGDVLKSLQ